MKLRKIAGIAGTVALAQLNTACMPSNSGAPSSAASLSEAQFARLSTAQANTIQALNARIQASANLPLDYLIQDVCVDGGDQVIAGDPAACPQHRNIRIGERVPYLVTDLDTLTQQTFQALSSYPVPGTDGELKVLVTKSMQGAFSRAFRFDFDVRRDGYDLIDTSGQYFSGIRTSDGGCLDQEISSHASREDGWIFFPADGGGGSAVHGILISALSPASTCARKNSGSAAHDVWNSPSPTTFESGKQLSSIVTYHYADQDLSAENNALERYFFTREYGFTRWEAWIPRSRCLDTHFAGSPAALGHPEQCDIHSLQNPLRGRCGPDNPMPGTAEWGGQEWVRTDCRDSTHYIALDQPTVLLEGTMAQNDGLVDIDSTFLAVPAEARKSAHQAIYSFGAPTLAALDTACDSAQPFSIACQSAVHRACQRLGYAAGMGPLEEVNGLMYGACLDATIAGIFTETWYNLAAKQTGCDLGHARGWECQLAMQRKCTNKYGAGAVGASIVEATGELASLVCLRPAATLAVSKGLAGLSAKYGEPCLAADPSSPACTTAYERNCQARGYDGVFGPIGLPVIGGPVAQFACLK